MADNDLEDAPVTCLFEDETTLAECTVDGVFSAGPSPSLMGLLIGGVVLVSLYVAGGRDIVVPSVATILFGASLVSILPAQYQYAAVTIAVLGTVVAFLAAWRRYTVRGGFR